jgi:putative two-component system response regulator
LIDAEAQPRILIVDDEPIAVKVLVDILRPRYGLVVARDGLEALERMKRDALPDLALVDVLMPGMGGLELCRAMKRDSRLGEVPVIFVSALGQSLHEAEGLEAGAADYIAKPISPPIVLARVGAHLALRRASRELARRNRTLEEAVGERTRELALAQDVTIHALTALVESRDQETGGHILRTQHYVRALARQMQSDPRYVCELDDHAVELMCKSSPLHDIGKVAIPDAVLLKPAKLTREEFEVMKTHTSIGRDALITAAGDPANTTEFLRFAIEIAGGHHERWDGSGYPQGLKGEAIPLSARLMALADVYDALRCARIYKPAMPHARAREIILEGRGRQFDPGVIDAFLRCEAIFAEIADRLADPDDSLAYAVA